MRWITKVALASFGISVAAIYLQRSFESLFAILYVSITLALISALLAVLTASDPERTSYLFSILIGIGLGTIIGHIFFTRWADVFPVVLGRTIERNEVPTLVFVSTVPPLLVLAYSLLLSRTFPYAWKEIRVRLISIAFLLMAYVFGSYLGFVISVVGPGFVIAPYMFLSLLLTGFSGVKKMFIYSNIITIAATYIATTGIEDPRRRVILAVGLILLMSSVASSPLLLALFYTWLTYGGNGGNPGQGAGNENGNGGSNSGGGGRQQ